MMSGEERRNRLVAALRKNSAALPARELAQKYDVSRQVVVQDVALLRANGYDIIATNRGYILRNEGSITRVFKVHHTREDCADEMNLIVDTGGRIEDVFIFHKHYGVVRADLKIRSRRDVNVFMARPEPASASNAASARKSARSTSKSEKIWRGQRRRSRCDIKTVEKSPKG